MPSTDVRGQSAGVSRAAAAQAIVNDRILQRASLAESTGASANGKGAEPVMVRQLMTRDVITVAPDTCVQRIAQLLIDNRISSVPVVDGKGRLVGIVSDSDLILRAEIRTVPRYSWWRSLLRDARSLAYEYVRAHGCTAADVMTRDPVTTTESTPLHKVAALLAQRFNQLPVLRAERLVGIISRTDLVRRVASLPAKNSGAERASDDALRERVMERIGALPWNMRIKAANANVEDGVATVHGWAGSAIERRALQVAVENTPGVRLAEDGHHRAPLFL
jgi:CBS domain-containing protein